MIRYLALTKRFGAVTAVDALSLVITPGEVVALLGPNGSGKTTALKAAVGLVRPTAGSVEVGEPPRPAGDAAARLAVSFLPQRVAFPDALSGSEVVEFYRRVRDVSVARARAALTSAGLNGALERAVSTYSGGMVQRLGLAVAALPEGAALLLDEPTAALDPEGLTAFYRLAEARRAEGRSVLFSSHQLGDAERLADRFALLVGGRLRATLTRRELADRLGERGVMRVRVAMPTAEVLARARELAPLSSWQGDELVVPGPTRLRAAVLDAARAAGADVTGLTAEEGRLDSLWTELVEGS